MKLLEGSLSALLGTVNVDAVVSPVLVLGQVLRVAGVRQPVPGERAVAVDEDAGPVLLSLVVVHSPVHNSVPCVVSRASNEKRFPKTSQSLVDTFKTL